MSIDSAELRRYAYTILRFYLLIFILFATRRQKGISMKLVTCCSFKGGAGKTTALMGLCSALAADGKTVALFEADENRPLTRWKANATGQNTWDPHCEIFIADELPLLEAAYEQADGRNFDYALVDTHGGSSELNNTIIASSNFLLVPTMLTPLDVDEALATYRYIIELLMGENLTIPTAMLRQRVPVGKLSASQRAVWEMLNALPLTDSPMYERDAFAAMKQRGMLHLSIRNMSADPVMRLVQRNLQTAMEELRLLGRFIQEALER
jgi:cellulose biosynthesis protein BcsQ